MLLTQGFRASQLGHPNLFASSTLRSALVRLLLIIGVIAVAGSTKEIFAACTGSGTSWTCTAGTTSAEVASALNSATDGATLTFQAGAYTWNSYVSFSNTKGATLICATPGACTVAASRTVLGMGGRLSGVNNRLYRISGFVFNQGSGGSTLWFYGAGTLSSLRIDHNSFTGPAGYAAIQLGENSTLAYFYGVVDHNTMTSTGSAYFVWMIGGMSNAPAPSPYGTANNLFIEDNTVAMATMTNLGVGCMDVWGEGAAIVWRHNRTQDCLVTSHGVTHHGGPANFEIYGNRLVVTAASSGQGTMITDGYRLFHHQGSGEFVAFDNSFTALTGKNSRALDMAHYRSYPEAHDGQDSQCDGTQAKDGNRAPTSTNMGYPCWRQPGRDFAGNLKPMYIWNNRWSDTGGKVDMSTSDLMEQPDYFTSHMRANREWYNAVSANAQTSPTSPFNGTTGMGFGTLANRPATCTTNPNEPGGGVGYWATDQGGDWDKSNGTVNDGALYRCSATNTWTQQYVPYTYPHPLVGNTVPTGDTTAPVVALSSPASGSTVSGASVALAANASDNVGVVGVQFRLDGANLGAEDQTSPYAVTWNTTAFLNGSHTLTAIARDAAGNQTISAAVTVTVSNSTADTTAPTVSITAPANGSTVNGSTVTVSANAADNVGVVGVQFRLDGANLGTEDTTSPYSISWNTSSLSSGAHTLTAVARDAAGNRTTSASISVTRVTTDTTAPTISITAPASGVTVSGSVTVSANASDNVAVVGVQFRLDGVNLQSEDTTSPYSVTWNTSSASDGSHTLTAVARDAAGNQQTSAAVTVTKSTPDTTAPTVSMTAPSSGATVNGSSVIVSANASDNVGVVGVQFRLDGANLGAEDTTSPYSVTWDTASVPDGPHSLVAVARDAAGNRTTSSVVSVTKVSLDTTLPLVSLTSPIPGATIAGASATVSANASDNVGVVGVQFRLDGANLGAEDTTSPYSVDWNATSATDGTHTLTASARDAAGNVATSATVSVVINHAHSYSISGFGGQIWAVDGQATTPDTEYVRVKPNGGAVPPVGVMTYGFRSGGTLISETTFPASLPVQSGRLYVESSASVKTLLTLANPDSADITVSFYFTNMSGAQVGGGSFTLPATKQVAAFLDSAPFAGPASMQGTFTFTASAPVFAVGARRFTNERGESLMANIPITALGEEGGRIVIFPRFVDRGAGSDSVVLVNSTGNVLGGTVQFLGQPSGTATSPISVRVNGVTNSTFSYSLPPQSAAVIRTEGATDVNNVRSVRITPAAGTPVPAGFSLFSYNDAGVTVAETGLSAPVAASALRMYVSSAAAMGQVGSVRTSVTLFNPSSSSVTIQSELRNLDGTLVTTASRTLVANGQVSFFANEILSQMPTNFRGVLRMTASAPLVAVGLRGILNERGEVLVTAAPVWNESIVPFGSEADFVHVLSGGGYSAQFAVFAPTPASASSGSIWVVGQNGTDSSGALQAQQ